MLNPELPLIERQSAANRCTVWMCVWLGECKTVLYRVWGSARMSARTPRRQNLTNVNRDLGTVQGMECTLPGPPTPKQVNKRRWTSGSKKGTSVLGEGSLTCGSLWGFYFLFTQLKVFFSSFSLLLLRVKGRGCHSLLKPYETKCDLWIWAIHWLMCSLCFWSFKKNEQTKPNKRLS